MLTITTTPKSISIVDSDRNRIVVLKGAASIELHSTIETSKKTANMLELQRKLGAVIPIPKTTVITTKYGLTASKKSLKG